jgi:hypothetical protein
MTPEEFPAVFGEGWALPKPQPFLDHFLPLVHPQATFTQPMFGDAHGPAEVERMFRRLFVLLPDLIATHRRSRAPLVVSAKTMRARESLLTAKLSAFVLE